MNEVKREWREIVLNTDSTVWDKSAPIEGTYVKVEHDVGPKKSNLYTIKTSDGEKKVWGSTVLDDKLADISEGTYLKIEYTGKERGKTGNEYHTFKVFIDDSGISLDDMPESFLT